MAWPGASTPAGSQRRDSGIPAQETIAFDGSRGLQTTTIELETDARTPLEVLALGAWPTVCHRRTGTAFPFKPGRQPPWLERQLLDPKHRRFTGPWARAAPLYRRPWAVGLDDEVAAIEVLKHIYRTTTAGPSPGAGACCYCASGTERNEAWALCEQAWHLLRPMLASVPAHTPRIWLT